MTAARTFAGSGLLTLLVERLKVRRRELSPAATRWAAALLKTLQRRVRTGDLTRTEALRVISAIATTGSGREAGYVITLAQVRAAVAGASAKPARQRTPSGTLVKRDPKVARARKGGPATKALPGIVATSPAKKATPTRTLKITIGQRAKPREIRPPIMLSVDMPSAWPAPVASAPADGPAEPSFDVAAAAPDVPFEIALANRGRSSRKRSSRASDIYVPLPAAVAPGASGDGGMIAESATAPPAPPVDPPRTCFPLLDSDSVVVSGVMFPLVVGLAEKQSAGVIGDALVRPVSSVGDYVMTIQVVATGFTPAAGESLRRALAVTARDPYPTFTLHLTADAQNDPVVPRAVQAIYSIESQTIGMAVRAVSVVKEATLLARTPLPQAETNRDLSVPVGRQACDVEVRIVLDRAVSGQLSWSIQTPFADIHVPDVPPVTNIGEDPQRFARGLMNGVNTREGQPNLAMYLRGLGKTIAQKMPADFWRIFREAASRAGRPPTVLILTEEPYVPWELACVDTPLPDAQAPPFLAAQAVLGRWPLTAPVQPPPASVDVSTVAVIVGVYNRPGWPRLQAAEDEAATLVNERFGGSVATKVDASSMAVTDYLWGAPAADLLHFAVHGSFDSGDTVDGLVMTDGKCLAPMDVRGADLSRHPFVFLNACQVGQGNTILGDYAGMAEAFLIAGSSGVIAPLWSIKDTIAQQLALEFYATSLTPAEYLRSARGHFRMAATPQSATYLAYQFFGHPALRVQLPPAHVAPPVPSGGTP